MSGVTIDRKQSMHWETAGDGPALVLLHAFPLDGRMWRGQAAALSTSYRVLVPDIPGFGRSERPAGAPSIDIWAQAVLSACKDAGVTRAVVAGASMGGYIAFAMLRLQAGFFAGLGLVNTRASADSQDARRMRYEMVERARHEGTGFLQQSDLPVSPRNRDDAAMIAFIRQMQADATSVGVMAAQRAMAARRDSRPQLAALAVPATVIYGLDDPIVPRSEAESMCAAIKGAAAIPIEGAGHLTPIERPDAVTTALLDLATRSYA